MPIEYVMTSDADRRLEARVRELYEHDGLSTRKIAELLGVGRRRVDAVLRAAGVPVAPRGAGRPRPATRHADPDDLGTRLRELYVERGLTRKQVAEKLGLSEGLVRLRLAEYGISRRSRGSFNREDRRDVASRDVVGYYQQRRLTADAAGERLGVSRRILLRAAHDLGVPVRPGAAVSGGVGPIELVNALYTDPLVRATLARYGVPIRPAGGPIWQRFPQPVPLTTELCADLYLDCGLSTTQVELLTGQPATKIRQVLRTAGVTLRPAGGRSPFRRRWEQQQAAR